MAQDARVFAPPQPAIDWTSLKGDPPPRTWWIQDWLGPWPTLTAGPGGAGKTRLWQMVATSLATGRRYLETQARPIRVLMWLCEESLEEVWRQQVAINAHFTLSMQSLSNLHIVPRMGLDNTLMSIAYGAPVFTGLLEQLRQQVNDLKADVLVLDNLAQLFGGNANDVHQATLFVNTVAGLVPDRPFAPVFVGHVARNKGSEFMGSAGWENACRMRWYVGPTLPDQTPDEAVESVLGGNTVYLAKRKANYSGRDWRKFTFRDGLLLPEEYEGADPGQLFRDDAADQVVLKAILKLKEMGVLPSDAKSSPDYLPRQTLDKKLAGGRAKREIEAAMHRLMAAGKVKRVQIGQYSNRSARYGLEIVGR